MTPIHKVIYKKDKKIKPVWLMRQAGRYLPEFRKLRKLNPDFIDLCLNKKKVKDITLQPLKRFKLDAAIVFSDILMVPYALGQDVKFIKGGGPQLGKFNQDKFFNVSEKEFSLKLNPVYKAIEITRKSLDRKKSLIAFIGAPWTLLIYMLNIKKDKNEINLTDVNVNMNVVLDRLVNFLCIHIHNQIEAGADVVQIFDSWASLIPEDNINDYCYNPNAKIVKFCKKKKIPNICFPKGIKEKLKEFNQIVKSDGINLDYEIEPDWVKKNLKDVVIQGGPSPKILLQPEKEMFISATKYIQTFIDIPYIFNLGHGLLPETDPDRVKKLIEFYRNFK